MKRKLIATLIALAMVVSLVPLAVLSAGETATNEVETSNLVITKKVLVDDVELDVSLWLAFNEAFDLDYAKVLTILGDITFHIYGSNADGDVLDEIEGVTGKIVPGTSVISFADEEGEPYEFATGWYIVNEVMGPLASQYFVDNDAWLFFYFNELNGAVTSGPGPEFTEETLFTIAQFKDQFRNIQALFMDEHGVVRNAITAPSILDDPPLNGGGALGTSRFEATQADNGAVFMSFCTDVGALLVRGDYVIDYDNQGLTEEEVLRLIAALDFIYTRSGFTEYNDIALAQLVVWNLVLEYSDDPMVADLWTRSIASGVLLKDEWGDLFKIEGIKVWNGVLYWYIDEYRDLINDIIAHAYDDKYVDIYKERIADGTDSFISGAYFLKGIADLPGYMHQRQLMLTFDKTITFVNEPGEGEKYGGLSIAKVVLENGKKTAISAWLLLSEGFTLEEIEDILDDITFYLYKSNKDGDKLDKVEDVFGKIDLDTSVITFKYDDVGNTPYDPPTGWYLVHEVLGSEALKYLSDNVPDLHIHFNSATKTVTPGKGPEFPDDAKFTIQQYKDNTRELVAIFEDEDGVLHYCYTSPALDVVPPVPGGGAFGTSRFTATQDNGDVYMSFCADVGAIQSLGNYIIDKTNNGMTPEQLLRLVAAIDFIYERSAFTDYDDIALAQLIVWNMILQYCDSPMSVDKWLLSPGLLMKDAWGELIKVEGVTEHNAIPYWYIDPYRELIDDIIANAGNDKYVDIYNARITDGDKEYVSAAFFLVGDGGLYNGKLQPHEQQSQLMITIGGPVTFDNEPPEDKYGRIILDKTVNGYEPGISVWLMLEKGFSLEETEDILNDIWFELYESNEDGDVLDKVAGVTGKIDLDRSAISFSNEDLTPFEAETGWYLVREKMGALATTVFAIGVPDLLIYFNAETEDVLGAEGQRAVFNNAAILRAGLVISAEASLETSAGVYVETWQGQLTPYKYYKSSSHGSVTATNDYRTPTIVKNSNHFCYATLNRGALVEGITLDLVVGNKCEKVGTAFVQLVGVNIVITFNDCDSASFGAVVSTAPFNVSNGNVHAGNNNYGFKKNNVSTIPVPIGPADGAIYLYIHGDFKFLTDITNTKPGYDPTTGFVWVEKAPVLIKTERGEPVFTTTSLDVFVTVFDADGDKVAEFTLNGEDADGGVKTLNGLAPGVYTVKWEFDYPADTTVYQGTIEVEAGKTVVFDHISKSYTENTIWVESPDSPILLPPIINPVVTVK